MRIMLLKSQEIPEVIAESKTEHKAFPLARQDREVEEAAKRLRDACDKAGGLTAVSYRSGVPMGTLRHYLNGRDMPRANLVALASACGVSVEWLATGREPPKAPEKSMQSTVGQPEEPPEEFTGPPPEHSARELEPARMATCLAEAQAYYRERRGKNPSWQKLWELAALFYDQMDVDGSP